ncbi:MAG: hypothetical protein AAGB25_05720, partial [Pseudomonadota bacterium]
MLVQTEPRHTLDAGCTSSFWLTLPVASTPQYETVMSMLLSAHATEALTDVQATGVGGTYCELT